MPSRSRSPRVPRRIVGCGGAGCATVYSPNNENTEGQGRVPTEYCASSRAASEPNLADLTDLICRRVVAGRAKGRSLPTGDTGPREPRVHTVVTSKPPWPPSWPCRPKSPHRPSCRPSCCSTYRWTPSSRFLRTSRDTSCPLLQSYPSYERTTFLPPVCFACTLLLVRNSGRRSRSCEESAIASPSNKPWSCHNASARG